MFRFALAALCASSLNGCAYFTTYQKDLGNPVTGVSMDAKQRVVLVRNMAERGRRVCAEPSPDALSALSASLGASFITDPNSTKQIAAALGETNASIGLRTTSIQLMRDAMYRACEAFLSDGISPQEYSDLQAHSQTLVVGLLAIEQLTGAVQAQQVSVVSNSGAGGITDVAVEADNLTQAKKATLEQKQIADDATKKKVTDDKAVAVKESEVNAAKKDSKIKPEDLIKLESDLGALKTAASDSGNTEKKEVALLKIQQQAEAITQQAFDLARTRVRATVSGDAKFSQQTRGNMSDTTAATVATSIERIVNAVVGQSVESQKCINFMTRPISSEITKDQFISAQTLCNIVANKEQIKIQQQRQLLNIQ